jgi:hypothetical protein
LAVFWLKPFFAAQSLRDFLRVDHVSIPCERDTEDEDTREYSVIYKGNENYELLFGGINDVTISMTYREFTRDSLARPSFFQNLVYETNAKEIRFKNFKITVIEASNEKMVYRVVEDRLEDSDLDKPDKVFKAILQEAETEQLRKKQ